MEFPGFPNYMRRTGPKGAEIARWHCFGATVACFVQTGRGMARSDGIASFSGAFHDVNIAFMSDLQRSLWLRLVMIEALESPASRPKSITALLVAGWSPSGWPRRAAPRNPRQLWTAFSRGEEQALRDRFPRYFPRNDFEPRWNFPAREAFRQGAHRTSHPTSGS
jgi:hypothetical protein